jgi:hypothetical protein
MLVAIAVFSIMVLLITGILGQLNSMWVQTEAQNQRDRSGRALLNFMARDIKKAMLPLPSSNTNSLDFVINPTGLGSASGSGAYNYFDNIFFQASVATVTTVGEVAEVGYFVQWQPASGSQGPTAQLCRFFVNPTDTTDFLIYTNPTTAWLTAANLTDVASGTSANNYAGLLAENVIGLWINPYDKYGSPFFTSSARTYDSRNPPNTTTTPNPPITPNLPAVVDISILILDPATAKRMAAAPSSATYSVSAVKTLIQSSTTITNADQCLTSLPAALQPGASCFTTRVQLSNSQ